MYHVLAEKHLSFPLGRNKTKKQNEKEKRKYRNAGCKQNSRLSCARTYTGVISRISLYSIELTAIAAAAPRTNERTNEQTNKRSTTMNHDFFPPADENDFAIPRTMDKSLSWTKNESTTNRPIDTLRARPQHALYFRCAPAHSGAFEDP